MEPTAALKAQKILVKSEKMYIAIPYN